MIENDNNACKKDEDVECTNAQVHREKPNRTQLAKFQIAIREAAHDDAGNTSAAQNEEHKTKWRRTVSQQGAVN